MLPKDRVSTSGRVRAYWKDDGRQDGLFLSSFWTPKWVSDFPVPILVIGACILPDELTHLQTETLKSLPKQMLSFYTLII